jgi:hypothetical protein
MKELPRVGKVSCEWLRSELEGLPAGPPDTAAECRSALSVEARQHLSQCAECEAALQDFALARRELQRMQSTLDEPGPWFTRRVMNAIAAQEAEIEETQNGFWTSVRRLAPRIVAFATLLLMLGGTWMFEQRRAAQTHGEELLPAEGLFELTPVPAANDDVIATYYEVQHQ